MRFTAGIACFLCACGCIERATGEIPSKLFTHDYVWVWWVVAVWWGAAGLRVLTDGAD
jgi:hypothetical protein